MDQSEQAKLVTQERKEYKGIPLKIMKLLGQGLLPVEAARAVGVVESYVSQLQAEPSFTKQVNELVAATMAAQSEIDSNYNEAEKVLSERLKTAANMMFAPDQILRSLQFLNAAKRKMAPALSQGQQTGINGTEHIKPVTLILPVALVREFTVNPNNEVVGIGGTELNTLPSANIGQLAARIKEDQKKLPAPTKLKINHGSGHSDPYSDL